MAKIVGVKMSPRAQLDVVNCLTACREENRELKESLRKSEEFLAMAYGKLSLLMKCPVSEVVKYFKNGVKR